MFTLIGQFKEKIQASFSTKAEKTFSIPISKIDDLVKINGKYVACANVTPLNMRFFKPRDLESVYKSILKALKHVNKTQFGIYIFKELQDVNQNIHYVQSYLDNTDGDEYAKLILENQLKLLNESKSVENSILKFYITVQSSTSDYSTADYELSQKLNSIGRELSFQGMILSKLDQYSYRKLIYELSNRKSSKHFPFDDKFEFEDVMPKTYHRTNDSRVLEIDSVSYKSYYISKFPNTEVDDYRWMKDLFVDTNFTFSVAMTFNPKPEDKIGVRLTESAKAYSIKSTTNKDYIEAAQNSDSSNSAKLIMQAMTQDGSWVYDANIMISICDEDKSKLDRHEKTILNNVRSLSCQARLIEYKEFDAFWSSLPIMYDCAITNNLTANLTSDNIARMLIFDSSQYAENKGIKVGKNILPEGEMLSYAGDLIVDFTDRLLYSNGHLAIVGNSGGGKTGVLLSLCLNSYPYYDYQFIEDLKGDFFFPFSKRFELDLSGKDVLNPFHFLNPSKFKKMTRVQVEDEVRSKVSNLLIFFSWHCKLDDYGTALLSQDLFECYERSGFYNDPANLDNEPTMSTLDEILKEKKDNPSYSDKERSYRADFRVFLDPLTNGIYKKLFNGRSTIVLSKSNIFGLDKITDHIRYSVQDLLHRDIDAFIRDFGTYKPPKSQVIIDETHKLVRKDHPEAILFIATKMLKEIRGFGCDVITATQNLVDYNKVDEAITILGNSHFKLFLPLSEEDYADMEKNPSYRLSPDELKLVAPPISRPGALVDVSNKGKGLFFIGHSQRFGYHNVMSAFELEVLYPDIYEMLYNKKSRFASFREGA